MSCLKHCPPIASTIAPCRRWKSLADGQDHTDYNAALLARSLGTSIKPKKAKEGEQWDAGFGSFHEKIELPSGLIDGSGHQMWSAAAYLNVCIRCELIERIDRPE